MKALVIGGGGREHALAWRLAQSDSIETVYVSPGNAGIALEMSCIPADTGSVEELASLAETLAVDFTVVGPEAPLVAGIADAFAARGLLIVGPGAEAAQLEGSKVYSKKFFLEHDIPTARAIAVESEDRLDAELAKFGAPVALKADGLAAGKGVVIAQNIGEAMEVGRQMLSGEVVGAAGNRLLIEEFLSGREVSFIVLADGSGKFFEFRATQDHKAAFDGDSGPNTGGMGAYCDDGILSDALRQQILDQVIEPTLAAMPEFRGFLYAGMMLTPEGPKALEFNVRLGDPETQPLLYRMTGDFGELLYSAARGSLDPSPVGWGDGATACVVMAAPGYPGTYEKGIEIEGFAAAEAGGAKVFHAGTRFKQGRIASSGGRVLGVTAAGSNLRAALDTAYGAVDKLSFPRAHFRKDIGARGL